MTRVSNEVQEKRERRKKRAATTIDLPTCASHSSRGRKGKRIRREGEKETEEIILTAGIGPITTSQFPHLVKIFMLL